MFYIHVTTTTNNLNISEINDLKSQIVQLKFDNTTLIPRSKHDNEKDCDIQKLKDFEKKVSKIHIMEFEVEDNNKLVKNTIDKLNTADTNIRILETRITKLKNDINS